MQSLRAVLWNSLSEKKLEHIFIFSKTSVVESRLIESHGNVLLETFTRKKSYSKNPPKTCEGKVPLGQCSLQLLGFHYTVLAVSFWLTDLTWLDILLHSRSVAGGWKSENMFVLCMVSNCLVCPSGWQFYRWYYYLFKFRCKQTLGFV